MNNAIYQFPRGNRKRLRQEFLLLKYLVDRRSYLIQNRRTVLSWSTKPVEYFYEIEWSILVNVTDS